MLSTLLEETQRLDKKRADKGGWFIGVECDTRNLCTSSGLPSVTLVQQYIWFWKER